ncbi:uncharacterized protein LOC135814173 isoform X2 [Sycon ciliatum]|uniref:uncharacterized protein LOC135814173 isoform X2 n=1 Tax=Sycon ciliatum TaxID=27933 RepID=UPI0031F5F963
MTEVPLETSKLTTSYERYQQPILQESSCAAGGHTGRQQQQRVRRFLRALSSRRIVRGHQQPNAGAQQGLTSTSKRAVVATQRRRRRRVNPPRLLRPTARSGADDSEGASLSSTSRGPRGRLRVSCIPSTFSAAEMQKYAEARKKPARKLPPLPPTPHPAQSPGLDIGGILKWINHTLKEEPRITRVDELYDGIIFLRLIKAVSGHDVELGDTVTTQDRLKAVMELCTSKLRIAPDVSVGQLRTTHGAKTLAFDLQKYSDEQLRRKIGQEIKEENSAKLNTSWPSEAYSTAAAQASSTPTDRSLSTSSQPTSAAASVAASADGSAGEDDDSTEEDMLRRTHGRFKVRDGSVVKVSTISKMPAVTYVRIGGSPPEGDESAQQAAGDTQTSTAAASSASPVLRGQASTETDLHAHGGASRAAAQATADAAVIPPGEAAAQPTADATAGPTTRTEAAVVVSTRAGSRPSVETAARLTYAEPVAKTYAEEQYTTVVTLPVPKQRKQASPAQLSVHNSPTTKATATSEGVELQEQSSWSSYDVTDPDNDEPSPTVSELSNISSLSDMMKDSLTPLKSEADASSSPSPGQVAPSQKRKPVMQVRAKRRREKYARTPTAAPENLGGDGDEDIDSGDESPDELRPLRDTGATRPTSSSGGSRGGSVFLSSSNTPLPGYAMGGEEDSASANITLPITLFTNLCKNVMQGQRMVGKLQRQIMKQHDAAQKYFRRTEQLELECLRLHKLFDRKMRDMDGSLVDLSRKCCSLDGRVLSTDTHFRQSSTECRRDSEAAISMARGQTDRVNDLTGRIDIVENYFSVLEKDIAACRDYITQQSGKPSKRAKSKDRTGGLNVFKRLGKKNSASGATAAQVGGGSSLSAMRSVSTPHLVDPFQSAGRAAADASVAAGASASSATAPATGTASSQGAAAPRRRVPLNRAWSHGNTSTSGTLQTCECEQEEIML